MKHFPRMPSTREYARFRLAGPGDDGALRALLRENAMAGQIALCLEREPDYFAANMSLALFGDDVAAIGEDPEGIPVGMYGCARMPVYVNGNPQDAAYLHGLRISRSCPNRVRVRILRDGFASIPRLVPGFDSLPCRFTSIAAGNRNARRILESGVPGLPTYSFCGEMVTLVIATRAASRTRKRHPLLRRARPEDIPALAAFYNRYARDWQFAPQLREEWLKWLSSPPRSVSTHGLALEDFLLYEDENSGGTLRAVFALWDQRHCKQTVVRGYRGPLRYLRRAYNLWAGLSGRVALPAPGSRLEQIFLAFAAFDLPPEETLACLRQGLFLAAQKNAAAAVLGLSAAHPLLETIATALRAERYTTRIETVRWPQDPPFALDSRPPQPEVALL